MTDQPATKTATPATSIVAAVLIGIGFMLAIVWFVSIPAAVAGLVLAHRGKARTPRGLWLATIIVGYVALALGVFWAAMYIPDLLG